MRSSCATPPIGSSVTVGVVTPNRRAMKMWPNSWATTHAKSSNMNTSEFHAASAPPAV